MNQLILWRHVGLNALLFVFIGGCAANMAVPITIEERAISPLRAQPQPGALRTSDSTKPNAVASESGPGVVVHIDPITGEFLNEPPANGVTLQEADATKALAPKFDVVPSPTPGGGVMIDLQGHFQTPLVATIDADGRVKMKHEPMSSIGTENK